MDYSNIKQLFEQKDIRFSIPEYQRAYSWGEPQYKQFIEDLKECNQDNYWLGHFLFEQDKEQNKNIYYIIDGQQRLTTIIIFFSAFIKVLKQRETEWIKTEQAQAIKDKIAHLSDTYLKDSSCDKQRFTTVRYDNNFFLDIVIDHNNKSTLEEFSSMSQKAIYETLRYFEITLTNTPIDEILSWSEALENATITTFMVKDKTQAAQIFSYQNDRGKELSSLEILKSYFLLNIYRLPNSEDNLTYIENGFEDIYKTISIINTDEDSVLNYFWRAIGPKGYDSNNTISEIKDWLKTIPQSEQAKKIKDFMNQYK